jgi:hypothetical protein
MIKSFKNNETNVSEAVKGEFPTAKNCKNLEETQ